MTQFIAKGVFIEPVNDVANALRFQWLIDCSCSARKLTAQGELPEAVESRALGWKIFTFSLMNINFSSGEVASLASTLFVRRCLFIRAMSFFALVSVSLFDRPRFISLENSIQWTSWRWNLRFCADSNDVGHHGNEWGHLIAFVSFKAWMHLIRCFIQRPRLRNWYIRLMAGMFELLRQMRQYPAEARVPP